MSSDRPPRYIGQIFFDGSSTLLGVGDGFDRGGYRGRLDRHYNRYTLRSTRRTSTPRPECPFVMLYGTGVFDRMVEQYAPTLPNDLDLMRQKGVDGFGSRMVAVLTMGSSLVSLLTKYDGDKSRAMQHYADAMDAVRNACETRGVSTIGVGLPLPSEGFVTADGFRPSRELRQETIKFSQEHLKGWRVPNHFLPIDEITDSATDRASDGTHLNAAGYHKVTQALITLIDPLLDINSTVEHRPFYIQPLPIADAV